MDYDQLISVENIFQAYFEFRKGKKRRLDLQVFERNLEDNLFNLHLKLKNKAYRHGGYKEFFVNDPKRRHIHKATVEDRIVHHVLYKYLYNIFDKTFIYDSYSCRIGKGTHKGVKRLEKFARIIPKNYKTSCWSLKLDIKKFFASVDHKILLKLLRKKVKDKNTLWLLKNVIESFRSEEDLDKGIPLGNLTSQIFANVYMNEFDQFIKQKLRIKYYLRYADDFIIVSSNKTFLYQCIDKSQQFLNDILKLHLHPDKIILRKLSWGIDFLGYIVLPYYILPRTKTKKRIFRKVYSKIQDYQNAKLSEYSLNQTIHSFLGYLKHANSFKLEQKLGMRYNVENL